jgi:hypothetical protein
VPAGAIIGRLSASGPGSSGVPSSVWPRGWSQELVVPGGPKPALVMPSGAKRSSAIKVSQASRRDLGDVPRDV